MIIPTNDWSDILKSESEKEYFKNLISFLKYEYKNYNIYPKKEDIFNVFTITPYSNVKVVILGQDPYYNPYQADGLAFSVNRSIKIPPSLLNILKELKDEGEIISIPKHGNLLQWATQGVFLLNTCLTVRENNPNSHCLKGWEVFTDNIISHLNLSTKPIVFLLWGNCAISKSLLITNKIHLILSASHPSPLSAYRSFFGCGHFKKTNEFLISMREEPINWNLL